MCTFIRFLHGGQLKGGWLGHLSTSISLFYSFVIPETCSSKVVGCTMCVNGTNNLPNCTQCQAGTTLDSQTNECKSNRKSLLICLSICPSVTSNKHKAYLRKWWQNGTRCRDGVKVFWI